jgi:catalase
VRGFAVKFYTKQGNWDLVYGMHITFLVKRRSMSGFRG